MSHLKIPMKCFFLGFKCVRANFSIRNKKKCMKKSTVFTKNNNNKERLGAFHK